MNKLNKLLPLMALTLVAATSALSAVDDMQVRNLENRVNALEQRRGANGMVNPPAHPVVKDGTNLWVQTEALFMHATEDGVSYGIKQETSSSTIDGRVKNISYDWSWGWRAGIGYNLPHDGWDMLLNYTWFRSNENNSSNTDAPESIRQTWTNPYQTAGAADALVAHAKGHTHLKFDYLDFQLGREFFVSKWLTLRPFMGARALWAHRDMSIKYSGGDLAIAQTPRKNIKEHLNNHFRGAGLLAGLDTQWGLGEGWSLYGQFGISLIYGKQRLHEKQDALSVTNIETRIAHIHDNWTIVRMMTDLGFGLRWDHLFYSDAYRIRLQLGWEQHLLSGFDKDINFVSSSTQGKFTLNQGDFALSGLALQVRFDF
jgi:hypothetical protein